MALSSCLRVLDADDVEGADADPIVRDAEPDALARQVVALEELAQRDCERLGVAELAADHDAVLERRGHRLKELGRIVVRHAGRSDL